MRAFRATTVAAVLSGLGVAVLVPLQDPGVSPSTDNTPVPAAPNGAETWTGPQVEQTLIDLTEPGSVVWASTEAVEVDTLSFPQQIQKQRAFGPQRAVKDHLPVHGGKPAIESVPVNELPVGRILEEARTTNGPQFPGIDQTAWVPPDPSIAVGPSHVVETVNQSVGWFTRGGTQEFEAILGSQGNPGFLEDVGAQTFAFDPKCFYDHYEDRFLVLALEVYDSGDPAGTAFITIAVSDDSNPNGTWYKYRTDAKLTIGATNYWWDYPGLGYDEDAYYVTGNLFGFGGGFAGTGYRIFDKTPLLTGAPAVFATLQDGSSASTQVAQHFGTANAPYFVSVANSAAVRIQAISNPLTTPTLVTQNVSVPSFSGPSAPPAPGGNTVSIPDLRIMNACWRNDQLYLCHTVFGTDRNLARWYQIDTGTWPNSGSLSLVQSGNIDIPGLHSWYPAIYANANDEVAVVIGTSSENDRIAVEATARFPSDPPGFMGAPIQLVQASVNSGGRWGDYYDIAIDPLDDTTFWVVGEYPVSGGWSTWVGSVTAGGSNDPIAVSDAATAQTDVPQLIDVLANDFHRAGLTFAIDSVDGTSNAGGSVAIVPGTPDQVAYTSPAGFTGTDSFSYTIIDTNNVTSTATVAMNVFDNFRAPDNPGPVIQGLDAAYYAVSGISVLPDFSTLSPYLETAVPRLNIASTGGNFSNSTRMDNVGAVYTGFVDVPALDVYTFYTESDDGSRLLIGDQVVVDNDGLHGMQERSGTIPLQPGLHELTVEFFEAGGGAGLIVSIQGGGIDKRPITRPRLLRPGCVSDFDGDGTVSLNDLALVLANFGRAGTAADGDTNDDGVIDLNDLAQVLAQFGQSCD